MHTAPSQTYSNPSQAQREHELLMKAWSCALVGGSAVYLSGPISTGPRFVDWYLRVGALLKPEGRHYRAALEREVIAPNISDLSELASRLRGELHESVVEPASFLVDEWSQDDDRLLWSRVVEHFVARVIMMPGWE